jgi:1,4-alpha-glucan branching enzyme
MVVNPRLLFLYWTLDEGLRRRLEVARGPAEVLLERPAESGRGTEIGRTPVDVRTGSWYLPVEATSGRLLARIGMRQAGRFQELLRSEPVSIPRVAPGSDPEVWMDVQALRAGRAEAAAPPPLRPSRGAGEAQAAVAARRGEPHQGTLRTAPGPRPAFQQATSPARHAWADATAWPAGRSGTSPAVRGAIGGEAISAFDFPGLQSGRGPAPKAPLPPLGIADPQGYLCFVLHAHLPFVRHPEREYFLEEHWLFEGITETYLPLLDMLDHIASDRVPVRLTVSISPTLATMLRDPLLLGKYERHLGRLCNLAWREVERTRRDPSFSPVAGFYWDRLHRLQHLFAEVYRRDLLAQFARLEDRGVVELLTCAATHGFLPHHRADKASVAAQVAVGVAEHRRLLERSPRGLWIPECAYFEGLDAILRDAGIEYFFVDTHAVLNATSPPRFGVHAPIVCPSGVAAFGRDEESSAQVWSSEQGYPGDPAYRDFYRDIGYDLDAAYVAPYLDPAGTRGMTGFKYHRITGRTDHKEPYQRDQALRAAARHAADFVRNRGQQIDWLRGGMDRPPLVVSMYDAELFGHWWFEGTDWLELVMRGLPGAGIAAISPGQYLARHPVAQRALPSDSSWGERGYFDVWLMGENDWILPPLHEAGRRMRDLARRFGPEGQGASSAERRALDQAGRELLLAQASDWPFILKNRTTPEYARRRVHQHLSRFDRLARMLERRQVDSQDLGAIEEQDRIFPDLDPGLWSRP